MTHLSRTIQIIMSNVFQLIHIFNEYIFNRILEGADNISDQATPEAF
jgi:hypothetical protein